MNGRRPIATTTLSTVTVCSPVASAYLSVTPSLPRFAPLTLAPRRMSRPCFLKCLSASFATCWSAMNRNCSMRLEHDDLGAEPAPDAAEFEADDAGADHAEALRHGVELERAPGIDDLLAVERHATSAPSAPSPTRARRASRPARCLLPSSAVYSTRLPASSLPWPCSAVTPAALNSAAMPCVDALTISALRFCMVATSNAEARRPRCRARANSACAR